MFFQDRPGGGDENTFIVEGEKRFSYAEVFAEADTLFEDLPRSVILILCDKSRAFVTVYLGALRAELVPLLIDAGATAQSIARTIEAYRPRYVAGARAFNAEGYQPFRELETFAVFEAVQPAEYAIHEELALLIPTSGSTGDPKCVRLAARNIEACTAAIVDYLEMTAERVAISLLPFHYSYGLSVLHNVIFARAAIVLTEKSILDRDFWHIMESGKVTDFSGVPFIFEMLRRMRLSPEVLSNLTCITQAGGRLDPKFTRHFADYFKEHGVRYFTMYGQTEAAPRIAYVPPEMALEKLGSVGIPIGCGKVSLADGTDPESGGELIYEGPNVCLGYAFSAGDLAEGDVFKGTLHTGDHASIDGDGFITIVGRKKRFIKLHGISVNLDHVEAVLKAEGVDCMVAGKEDRLLVCTLESQHDAASEAMKANFNFHPTTVRVKTLESLPFNASGKPDYPALSELL